MELSEFEDDDGQGSWLHDLELPETIRDPDDILPPAISVQLELEQGLFLDSYRLFLALVVHSQCLQELRPPKMMDFNAVAVAGSSSQRSKYWPTRCQL